MIDDDDDDDDDARRMTMATMLTMATSSARRCRREGALEARRDQLTPDGTQPSQEYLHEQETRRLMK